MILPWNLEVQAFKEIKQILLQIWLPEKMILDIQSFSSKLYENIIDYIFT